MGAEVPLSKRDIMPTAKPLLTIWTAPNSGFEFALHTDDGKISAVVSVARPARPDIRTIAEKERDALLKLKRLAKALDHAVTEMIH
jgi:hypothetical protein